MAQATSNLDHDGIRNFAGRIQDPNQASEAGLVELVGQRDDVDKPTQRRVCQALLVGFMANLVHEMRDLRDAQLGGCLCGCWMLVTPRSNTRVSRRASSAHHTPGQQAGRRGRRRVLMALPLSGPVRSGGEFPVAEAAPKDVNEEVWACVCVCSRL